MGILSNARIALAATILIVSNATLAEIEIAAVNNLVSENPPSDIAAAPMKLSTLLDKAIAQLATTVDDALMNVANNLIGTAHAATTAIAGEALLDISTASASSYDVSHARIAALAIDGNLTTKWTALSMPQSFIADLGSSQMISRLRMNIYAPSSTNYSIDVSQDKKTWTATLSTIKVATTSGWLEARLTPVVARYVRIRFNSAKTTDYVNLSELEIYGQGSLAIIAGVTASAYDSTRLPSLAIDGDLSSKWTALSLPQWLIVDLGSVQAISGINMKIYVANAGANATYAIDVSSNKTTWATALFSTSLKTSSEWVTANFTPVTGRYVRLRLNSTKSSDYVNLNEIQVYAQALPGDPAGEDINNISLKLTWKPSTGSIQGYKIFFGPTADSAITEVSDISNTLSASFNPATPAIQYDSWYTLRLLSGDNACFKVRAYNADGLSTWSLPICGVITEAAS